MKTQTGHRMIRRLAIAAAATALLVGFAAVGLAVTTGRQSHNDSFANPDGCAGCHAGRGISGTALLVAKDHALCFRCHGYSSSGPGRARTNLEAVFQKTSVHPVRDTAGYHSVFEVLPAQSDMDPRHVSCDDCHRVHITEDEAPVKGAKGYNPGSLRSREARGGQPSGTRLRQASAEYELCYLCHADSANRPSDSRNIAAEFDPDNISFHPVEFRGKNNSVPSLMGGLRETSMISCGSCHGNNDPLGPRGPHGSDYAPLLVAPYRTSGGTESLSAYALCYGCHDRVSILEDQSFKRHGLHIFRAGASCHDCHASHGSSEYDNLISFNLAEVSISNSGGIMYMPSGSGMPKCYLNCHAVEHSMGSVGGKAWPW